LTPPRSSPFPTSLTTARLTLRLPTDEDARVEHEMILEELDHLWPWFAYRAAPPTLEQRREVAARHRDEAARGLVASYVIYAGDRGVGKIWLEMEPAAARMGWWLRAGATGKGYATEAIRGLAAMAFNAGIERIEAHIDPDNAPSRALADRAGFRLEEVLTDAYERGDGIRRPECLYVLLRTEGRSADDLEIRPGR